MRVSTYAPGTGGITSDAFARIKLDVESPSSLLTGEAVASITRDIITPAVVVIRSSSFALGTQPSQSSPIDHWTTVTPFGNPAAGLADMLVLVNISFVFSSLGVE
jgi:hypothetical protein